MKTLPSVSCTAAAMISSGGSSRFSQKKCRKLYHRNPAVFREPRYDPALFRDLRISNILSLYNYTIAIPAVLML